MRLIFKALLVAGLAVTGAAGLYVWQISRTLPDDSRIVAYQPRHGRPFVPIKAIPPVVVQAFLAAEDGNFFSHPGVDLPLMLRAAAVNLMRPPGRRPIGASTITQQLVKNLILGDEVSFSRKVKEVLLALRI